MPPVKAGGGASPLSSTTSNTKGGSGNSGNIGGGGGSNTGGYRGPHDASMQPNALANTATASQESILLAQDFISQLLRIARGDLTAAAALGAGGDGGAWSLDANGHPLANTNNAAAAAAAGGTSAGTTGGSSSGKNSVAAAAAAAAVTLNSSTGDLEASKCGSQVRANSVRSGQRRPSWPSSVPMPVAVLRSAEAEHNASPHQQLQQHQRQQLSFSPAQRNNYVDFTPHVKEMDACVSTDAEACAFYLTALVAHALHMEDYWIDLGHQVEVDQHVEFLQFCADAGFGTLKTMHLLHWWRQFRALVRNTTATHAVQLSDGNPLKPFPASPLLEGALHATTTLRHTSSAAAAAASAASAVNGGSEGSNANLNTPPVTAPPATAPAAAGGGAKANGAKKGRRGSAGNADADAATAAAAAGLSSSSFLTSPTGATPAGGGGTAAPYTSHDIAVQTELQRFVQWELEHEYEWRLVPREPANSLGSGLISPTGGGAAPSSSSAAATAAAAAQASAGKSSKADRAKLQLQQQQELEVEEQRLARIASLPPENIFLTKAEVEPFVRVVVQEDLFAHAALHAYVAAPHARQPTRTLTHAAVPPAVFAVVVETPMAVAPLREATRVVWSAAANTGSATASPRMSGDVTEGRTGSPQNANGNVTHPANSGTASTGNHAQPSPTRAPSRPTSSAPSKPRSRGSSKNAAAASSGGGTGSAAHTSASAAEAATTAAEATTITSNAPHSSELQPGAGHATSPSPMELLRAAQLKESAQFRAAYAAEVAHEAATEQQAQHAADVNLFFAKSSTAAAVQAVYASMEDAVAARQQRILQRVAALEAALGLTEGEGGAQEGGAGVEGL